MTRELPLDVLACPACRGALARVADALACVRCSARYAIEDRVPDLIPADLRREVEGKGADRAWARWHEAMRGLERWRALRALRARGGVLPSDGADEPETRTLIARANLHGVVVDVGAKDAARYRLLPARVRYVGIDPFASHPEELPPHATLVRGVVEALPVHDRAADAVICLAAFDYFIDGPAALAEMARILRPRGTLAMLVSTVTTTVAHARGARSRAARVAGSLRAVGDVGLVAGAGLLGRALLERDRPHTHYYTRTQVLSMLAVRFEVDSVVERPQRASTILYVVARKRSARALPMVR
jgi:uncharacterized protein YbaR (Trm112 family)